MTEITHTDLHEAIDRIARTRDGAALYRYLQKTLCAVSVGSDMGALQRNEGRRSYASELMALMAEGIATHDRSDAIVTFALAGPKRLDAASGRGAGRRITADTPIPGWDRDTP